MSSAWASGSVGTSGRGAFVEVLAYLVTRCRRQRAELAVHLAPRRFDSCVAVSAPQALEPGPALAATIAFETAWRIRSEVLTLTWDRVDIASGWTGPTRKNGSPGRRIFRPRRLDSSPSSASASWLLTASLAGSFPTYSSTPRKDPSKANGSGSLTRRGGRPVARPVILLPCCTTFDGVGSGRW